MNFEVYEIGNRIAIKTLKEPYQKITHLRYEEAKKTIQKIHQNGWTIHKGGEIQNKEIKELIQVKP